MSRRKTTKHPTLVELDRLEGQLKSCRRHRGAADRERSDFSSNLAATNAALTDARKAEARGEAGATETVAKLEAKQAELKDQIGRLEQKAQAADQAARETEQAIRELRAREPEPFTEEGLAAVARAEDLRIAAIEAIEAYRDAWAESVRTWQPQIEAIRSVEQVGERPMFGARSGFDLGPLPQAPAIIGGPRHPILDPLAELEQAPPPMPAGVREPRRFRDNLTKRLRKLFGVEDSGREQVPEPDQESAPTFEVIGS